MPVRLDFEEMDFSLLSEEKIKDGDDAASKKKKFNKEIERLESVIFGDTSKVVGEKKQTRNKKKRKQSSNTADDQPLEVPKKVPVWQDDDDEESIQAALQAQSRPNIEHVGAPTDAYTSMLKRKFESIVGTPKWADINRRKVSDSDGSEDEDGGLLQRCGNLIEKRKILEKGTIKFKMVKTLNNTTECEGTILKNVEFHPTSSIGLVAGFSGIASLFEVDGKVNAKLQSIEFSDFCIYCAKFSADGNKFIVGSSQRKHFFTHDLLAGKSIKIELHKGTDVTNLKKFEVSPDGKLVAVCGNFGNILLLNGKSYEWIDTLRVNGSVESICFSSDGNNLFAFGDEGNTYVFNLNSRSCVHKFADEGCLKGTSVGVSPDGTMLACGSSSGVVNVYNSTEALSSQSPSPVKVFLNLTTPVNCLKFNHTSQILAMSSDRLKNSFKLAHFPSMTVFSNFPQNGCSHIQTGIIQNLAFSPNSGYLGCASNTKKAFLYRLNNFGSY